MGVISIDDDQQALGAVFESLLEAGEDDAAEVVRFSTLSWWTDCNEELGLVLGSDYAQWYPEHFATLTVPPGAYGMVADLYELLGDAVADALGAHSFAPLRDFTICEEPGPAAEAGWSAPETDATPMVRRGDYLLTPIEARFYDELRETDLTFSVQATVYSAGQARRPDFIVYPGRRPPVIIELDGHEYHRSRAQRTADARRERWLTARGFDFMRFTGTEISADAQRCVRELRDWISRRRSQPIDLDGS